MLHYQNGMMGLFNSGSGSTVAYAVGGDANSYMYRAEITTTTSAVTVGTSTQLTTTNCRAFKGVMIGSNWCGVGRSGNYVAFYVFNASFTSITKTKTIGLSNIKEGYIVTESFDSKTELPSISENTILVPVLAYSTSFVYAFVKITYDGTNIKDRTIIYDTAATTISSDRYSAMTIFDSSNYFAACMFSSDSYWKYKLIKDNGIKIKASENLINGVTKTKVTTTTAGDVYTL